jgi:septal ring factor EnvC (AmiA/AmiB activator)
MKTAASLPLAVLASVATVLLVSLPGEASKDKLDPLAQKIERERQALETIQAELREKKRASAQAKKKMASLIEAIQELDAQLVQSRLERQELSRRLKQKDRELEEINASLGALRASMNERRRSILARLRVQYMEGRMGLLKHLLAADNYADLHRRYRYLAAVSRREYDLLQAYRNDAERLEQMEREQEEARNAMLALKAELEQKMADIQEGKRRKSVLLAKIMDEKAAYDRMVAELERSARRVDTLLKELLAERAKVVAAHAKPPSGRARALLGQFLWPVEGDVVAHFGRQKHPVFDTYVQRKGIEIRTPEGSAIKAAMAGTVAFADWLKGYGLVVILDHANGFFSLYAHASALAVKVGDRVQTGQIIGWTGDTGMTSDNTLYFELRDGAEPVDPLIWLAKRN